MPRAWEQKRPHHLRHCRLHPLLQPLYLRRNLLLRVPLTRLLSLPRRPDRGARWPFPVALIFIAFILMATRKNFGATRTISFTRSPLIRTAGPSSAPATRVLFTASTPTLCPRS